MSGKDDQQTPDTENDNPANTDAVEAKADAIPEVEAEIVDADEMSKVAEAAEETPDTIDAVVEEVVHEEEIAAAPKSGVSPGIILVGVLALFGGGLLISQFMGGNKEKTAISTALEQSETDHGQSGEAEKESESGLIATSSQAPVTAPNARGDDEAGEGKITANTVADAAAEGKNIDLSSNEVVELDARIPTGSAEEITEETTSGTVDPRAAILALQEQAARNRETASSEKSEAVEASLDGQTAKTTADIVDAAETVTASVVDDVVGPGEAIIGDAQEAGAAVVETATAEFESKVSETANGNDAETNPVIAAEGGTDATPENKEKATEVATAEAASTENKTAEGIIAETGSVGGAENSNKAATNPVVAEVAAVPDASTGKIANEFAELKEVVQQRTAALDEALSAERVASEQQAAELAALRSELSTALEERDRRSNEDIAELRDRIEKIQTGGLPAGRQAMAALALNALQKKVSTGDVYTDELEVLARLAPDAPVIGAVRPFAATGVPTIAALAEEFDEVRRDAMAAYKLNEAKGPIGKMMANLSNLVSVRPANPTAGEDPVAIISRVEGNLRDENLVGAMGELTQLPEDLLASFSDWKSKAEATKEAIVAIDEMNSALLNQFGEPSDG